MKLTKTLITLGMASALMLQMTACKNSETGGNPLLEESTLPYGAPDFSRIKTSDYVPAVKAAIEKKRANIKTITDNEEAPTFENTIVAYEESGRLLERVTNVLYALVSADKTPEIAEAEKEVTPLLTDLDNEVMFNKALFERIKTVYDNHRDQLEGEDQRLLDETYKQFVRSGALLSDEDAAEMKKINLRRRVFEASIHRADGNGKHNTFAICTEIAQLRARQAQLMGYDTYAAYSLEKTMAKTPDNVYAFLRQLIAAYTPKADAETKAIEAYAKLKEGSDFTLEPYDRFYYSAKMKKEMLNISDEEVKPYFNADSVLQNGVFYAANRVYGLTFKERTDIPVYHPDVKVYEVFDKDGQPMALFYSDLYRRPTKRGGAWMSEFLNQSRQRGQMPVIYNVCNSAKAPEGQPSLLTWDEVTTMFHEFGHALHALLSDCQYNSLAGTSVARDFVEMPSQFNESFASIPEIFDHYAKHAVTGEPMPAELKERMLKSINFQTAYALGENLGATCVDMAWHMLPADQIPSVEEAQQFEINALEHVGLLNRQVPPRYMTSYFNHIWGSGYAAGYYSYLWTEVLAVNIADCFAQRGALNPEVGQDMRDKILSRGNTRDLMQIFTDFTGMEHPDASGLLKARGL